MAEPAALLLLPGLLCDEALWAHPARHLRDIATPVVADLTLDDRVEAMARRAIAGVEGRFDLVGLSMGGYVALAVMRLAPERVRRLALLDTSPRADGEAQKARRLSFIKMARTGRFRGVTPRLMPALVHPDRVDDAALSGAVMGMAERVGQEAFLRQQTAIMERPDARAQLGAITCPTLVLCGREDAVTPLALHREMAGAIPGAVLSVIEECGHLPPLERPQATTAVLRLWLEGALDRT